jgi:hypothetical protein
MDASVPTINHLVSLQINEDILSSLVDIDTASPIQTDASNPKTAFRMFAFLPYGKGVFLSRTYAISLPSESTDSLTIYSVDFNDGYSGSFESYPSPSFMLRADFMGESSTAFGQGPCYESVDLWGGDSGVIVVGGDEEEETGACVCEVEDGGFRRAAVSEGDFRRMEEMACSENSSPLVNYTLSEGVAAFTINFDGDDVASSFYYGVDPSPDGDERGIDYSYEAFYDTDGFNDDDRSLHHGIVRAEAVASIPSATIPLKVLPIEDSDSVEGNLVVGGVWIDSQFIVKYSRETKIPLSDIVESILEEPPTASPVISDEPARESSLCPAGSVRNIALVSQGAFILDVSSSYSSTYLATNAIDGDASTEWSTSGDGNDAFITIQLPFASNIVYVELHTRTMGSSAQISEYQVEAGNREDELEVVGSSCVIPDASKSYECDLDLSDENNELSGGVEDVTLVSFRVLDSSGGNTGAVDVGVYGCSVADVELAATLDGDESEEPSTNGEKEDGEKQAVNQATESISKVISSDGHTSKMSCVFKAISLFAVYVLVTC